MPPLPIRYEFEEKTKRLIETYNTPTPDVIPFFDEQVTPVLDANKDNFEPYAQMSNDVYNKESERSNIRDYKYLSGESNENYGVYENDDEYHIAIKGTSKDSLTKDIAQDIAIGLGSLGSGLNYGDSLTEDISDIQTKINDLKKNNKKISLSGSSKGGSIASYVGIDNPDVDTITFNKGSGLPFISDMIKCKIYGCSNIKNYRISGDFASAMGNQIDNQLYETLRPKFPTEKEDSSAEMMLDFAIDKDLYIPHMVTQFMGRTSDNLDNIDRYPRKLAKTTGNWIGGALGAVLPMGASKLGKISQGMKIMSAINQGGQGGFVPDPDDLDYGAITELAGQAINQGPFVRGLAGSIGTINTGLSKFAGLNEGVSAFTGSSLGGNLGVLMYNQYYASDAEPGGITGADTRFNRL